MRNGAEMRSRGVSLHRRIRTFKREGIEVRTLYRTQDGPNPDTKARRREVRALARSGLERALATMTAGDVADLGASGFTTREDTFLCTDEGGAPPLCSLMQTVVCIPGERSTRVTDAMTTRAFGGVDPLPAVS